MKIQTWLKQAQTELIQVGIESARLDSLLLLENEIKKPRQWVLAHDEEELSEAKIESLNKKVAQRKNHIPLAYIIGSKEFYGRNFLINKDVLIPRPESEALIELLVQQCKLEDDPPRTILDVGTGSGILAITAQLELPHTTVLATDISEKALVLAKQNAARLKASVQFYEANLLDVPKAIKPDIVLANLPYVPKDLITSKEITKEPSIALFSGTDGLDHYRIFWNQIVNLPHKPSLIIVESLETQHIDLTHLAKKAGYTLEKTETLAQLFVRNK